MEQASLIGTLLLLLTGAITYKGFRDEKFQERYAFNVDGILLNRQFDRMIYSGFLHGGWFHFGFNMIALLSFSGTIEPLFGLAAFTGLYFASLLGGNFLALYVHRNHGDYSAVGASGAISGVIFSFIILYPNQDLQFILIDISFKAWILGVLFVVVSIFGIKTQEGNIGHEAHLGGALTGALITILLQPTQALENWWIVLLLVVPTLTFLVLMIKNPTILMIKDYWGESAHQIKTTFKKEHQSPQEELDELLDKISKKGIKSLSKKERERLKKLSK